MVKTMAKTKTATERMQDLEEDRRGVLERKAEKSRDELELKRVIRAKFLADLSNAEGPGAPAGDSVAARRVEALQRCFSDGEEGRDSDEIDDSEESLPTRDPPIVKTLCPYSRTRLILPVRSLKCHHGASQCIDLDSFLETSVMRVKNHEPYLKVKKCIVCGQEVDSMDLILDLWVKEISDEVFASPENNVTRVNINKDGTWSIPPQQVRKDVLVVDEADATTLLVETQVKTEDSTSEPSSPTTGRSQKDLQQNASSGADPKIAPKKKKKKMTGGKRTERTVDEGEPKDSATASPAKKRPRREPRRDYARDQTVQAQWGGYWSAAVVVAIESEGVYTIRWKRGGQEQQVLVKDMRIPKVIGTIRVVSKTAPRQLLRWLDVSSDDHSSDDRLAGGGRKAKKAAKKKPGK